MPELSTWIHSLAPVVLCGPDGEELRLEMSAPASAAQLASIERELGCSLPGEIRELYLCSDGCSFFGVSIGALRETVVYHEHRLLTIHNWGNGDFDCARVGASYQTPILFMNHNPAAVVQVADSILCWLRRVFDEVAGTGELSHPRDCPTALGVYSGVKSALRGIDCELNR